MLRNLFIRGSEFFSGTDTYTAKVTSDGELAVTSTERERNNGLHYQNLAIGATEYSVIVDLSDTTNFPHTSTGRIDISWLKAEIEKASSTAVGEVELGVITRIDGTDADIDYLWGLKFLKGTTIQFGEIINYAPSQLKFAASKYITNVSESNVAAVNTGASLDSPFGNISPGLGDVVVKQTWVSGTAYDFDLEMMYHSEV